MEIKPSTKDRPATIELSKEDEERIAKIGPDFFTTAPNFPEGIYSTKSAADTHASEVCKPETEK
jgi:hypothetical protein